MFLPPPPHNCASGPFFFLLKRLGLVPHLLIKNLERILPLGYPQKFQNEHFFSKNRSFLLTGVKQMQPALTLNCHKLVQNIKIRIHVSCDECVYTRKISQSSGLSVCLFLWSWIWAFEVSSRSQSYELQKLKWHFAVEIKMFHIEWTK